mgnify:CR=1 FL=1
MKNKVVNKLFGKELLQAMNELVKQLKTMNADTHEIVKEMKYINESVRVGIYLIALEKDYDDLAVRINRANGIINQERKEKFIKAYHEKQVDKFMATLGKADKISLMSDLEIDVDVMERTKLSKEQRDYYRIISNSIMLDQEEDNRDGLDQFIKHKKETE